MLDVEMKTTAPGHNPHLNALKSVLNDHSVRWIGQYRGVRGYAVVSDAAISAECRAAIDALDLPPRARIKIV